MPRFPDWVNWSIFALFASCFLASTVWTWKNRKAIGSGPGYDFGFGAAFVLLIPLASLILCVYSFGFALDPDAWQRPSQQSLQPNHIYLIAPDGKVMAHYTLEGRARPTFFESAVVFYPIEGGRVEWKGEYLFSEKSLDLPIDKK